MTQTMTTSGMTNKQIERAVEIFRAKLRKHAAELPSDAVQQVFGQKELGHEWLEVLRKRVEVISSMIVREVTVDGTRTSQAALDATGRKQYTDPKVVETMPGCESGTRKVYAFKLDRCVSDDDLDKEYELRGLVSAPREQAALNEADPDFADKYPNGTHWKDASGRWNFATFGRWPDERSVHVYRNDNDWNDDWWFVGVGK